MIMDTNSLILNSFLAIVLGAIIGLKGEHEKKSKERPIVIGGFRTHGVLALLGCLSGGMALSGNYFLAGLLSGSILLMVLIYYASGAIKGKAYGITDELTAIFAHFLGILAITQPFPIKFIVALTVILIFIINRKAELRKISSNISRQEIVEFTLYGVIALVILPFLPNKSFSLNQLGFASTILELGIPRIDELAGIEIINPFKTWFIVVFVSGLDLLGYILSKVISSENSLFFSATLGGFVSSTSTTIALAIQSKSKAFKNKIDNLVGAAVAANASSFIQVLILVTPISLVFLKKIFVPTLILIVGGFGIAFFLNRGKKKKSSTDTSSYTSQEVKDEHIFKLEPALKFAILLTLVKVITKYSLVFFGSSGFIFTSMLASLTGIDAIIINLSELTRDADLTINIAFITYMLANFVNIGSKTFYSFTSGNKEFARKFGLYMFGISIVATVVGFLI